jgi:hypothetical protein
MGVAIGVNKEQLAAKGQAIYERLKEELEPAHRGKIVAIEVESGEYFLGDSVVEAAKKARAKHPGKLFYFVKVGSPAVHVRR